MIPFVLGLVIGLVLGYVFALWEVWSDGRVRDEGAE